MERLGFGGLWDGGGLGGRGRIELREGSGGAVLS